MNFDFIVIGSGFGGSVSAMRLSEKGYHVAVLEAGKRYRPHDFPKTNWNLKKFLWFPKLGLYGILRLNFFKHVFILSGSGVGGGSLVYANTLLVPEKSVFEGPGFKFLKSKDELTPFYETAKTMLGVTKNPHLGTADRILKDSAQDLGWGSKFFHTQVGIYFGKPGVQTPDPYFQGSGPPRSGCNFCGGCMVGCRFDAKNTLDKNYLYFAEKNGAEVFPETTVLRIQPCADENSPYRYKITARKTTGWFFQKRSVFYAKNVVFSAGVLGTLQLLFQSKARGDLSLLSPTLGQMVRTNSESIIGFTLEDRLNQPSLSEGIAIGSAVDIDPRTQVQIVRYSEGSNFIKLLSTLHAEGDTPIQRILGWLQAIVQHPVSFLKMWVTKNWARSSAILLVMQSVDNFLEMRWGRSLWSPLKRSLKTEMNPGESIPAYIPTANALLKHISKKYKAIPQTCVTEILLNVPTTAHVLGGAVMGNNAQEGVINSKNEVFHYPGLYVCDGSMIPANLGVNPSLTITALTERAMTFIPAKDMRT